MKQYSSIRSVQILGHVLEHYGIDRIVVSPGSRNAPLAIHFSELDSMQCYSIVDERAAAFVGMGMAKVLKKPVALTCTSGSAATNYYPAIVEAFYQNVPLLILTADRPTDFVDIFDGQTIRQNHLYQQHSYGDFQLKEDKEENSYDFNLETVKKAVELCIEKSGPVHINIPLSEPLYNLVTELPILPKVESTIQKKKFDLLPNLVAEWNTSKRILILVGSQDPNPELQMQLSQLVKNHSAVILTEVTSNLDNEKFFSHIDRYIFNFGEEDFKNYAPDLLITVGQNVVSKKVKNFLRKAKPKHHWHVDENWQPDTYFVLDRNIEAKPEVFFAKLLNNITLEPSSYYNLWDVLRDKMDARHDATLPKIGFSDFYLFKMLSEVIPADYKIHFSNSSAIRYAQLFDFNKYDCYCNRGTSGIDGCTSTAMGFAMMTDTPTILVTGDISFFYDINGLWNQYIPPYTRIVIFNNGEGNIFRIIPGPSDTNAVDELIATQHHRSAELLAKHFGFDYIKAEDELSLDRVIDNFFKPGQKPKILEVMTQSSQNEDKLKDYFENLK
ncbi:2-succinyl-5-enolpyruvyl-6-hydroxy-3-cyclohexene-1-carboxylic-acid synthase [Soonwooa sp.]|uniref:2-succinyl-5-enolpyruvyl-6-hydroxy-3- cyclohexene-1-carboxylic-acid synthase n=1 Tax=Soonwooa sp. TaxID=1938592 RepID=UPI00260DBE2D|nr:2-succinyl-5-enolpyruvyl-6-hydroxy-3-cyclohexene-1-carboxylic-acid synthase [Soonwooa sp.]